MIFYSLKSYEINQLTRANEIYFSQNKEIDLLFYVSAVKKILDILILRNFRLQGLLLA